MKNFKKWFRARRIGVLLGGDSAERSISLKTGKAVFHSLKRQRYRVSAIDAVGNVIRKLKKHKINFAYIALHGTGGEDGRIQALLTALSIPYTGSRVLASALAMNKTASKRAFEEAHLPTAPYEELDHMADRPSLTLPVVVKPASQGSAVGVTVVKKRKDLQKAMKLAFRYDTKVLVEKYLEGPEVTVGILGKKALPVIEILPLHDRPFYDFHAKYSRGGSRHVLPARISKAMRKRCQTLSLAACRVLGTRGAARVDLIIDRRLGPCLLEVNTIPGMTETSLLPEAARAAGFDFDALVLKIAEESIG